MTVALATAERTEMAQRFNALRDFLSTREKQVAAVAGKALDTKRVLKICLDAAARTPDLLASTPESILQSLLFCGKLGLEPVGAWGVWLVPFKNKYKGGRYECTPIVDYRGMIQLVTRNGNVRVITAHVVYEEDEFEIEFGDEERLIHKPTFAEADKRGKLIAAYSVATLKDNFKQRAVLPKADIDRYRAKSRASSGPWTTDYEAMACKTAIRRVCNLLPIAFDVRDQLEEADQKEFGDEAITIDVTSNETETEADETRTPELGDGEPAPTPTPKSNAEALKNDLKRDRAQPSPESQAVPPEPSSSSTSPKTSDEEAPAAGNGNGGSKEPALSEQEMQEGKAELDGLREDFLEIMGGKDAGTAIWNGTYGVKTLRGMRTRPHLDERLNRAREMVDLGRIGIEIAAARQDILKKLGTEKGTQKIRDIAPKAVQNVFTLTVADAKATLDVLVNAVISGQLGEG